MFANMQIQTKHGSIAWHFPPNYNIYCGCSHLQDVFEHLDPEYKAHCFLPAHFTYICIALFCCYGLTGLLGFETKNMFLNSSTYISLFDKETENMSCFVLIFPFRRSDFPATLWHRSACRIIVVNTSLWKRSGTWNQSAKNRYFGVNKLFICLLLVIVSDFIPGFRSHSSGFKYNVASPISTQTWCVQVALISSHRKVSHQEVHWLKFEI